MKARMLPVALLLFLTGCPPAVGPNVDLTHPAGRAYTLTQVAPLPEKQPTIETPVDALATYRGQPGRALPPGAVVHRFASDEPRAIGSRARHVDPAHHPWVFVEVSASPYERHVGWTGWVHVSLLGDGPPVTELPGTPDLLASPSRLCQWPDGAPEPGDTCALEIHPSLYLDVLVCDGNYAQVQLWDPDGHYVAGFLKRSHFKTDPCPR